MIEREEPRVIPKVFGLNNRKMELLRTEMGKVWMEKTKSLLFGT